MQLLGIKSTDFQNDAGAGIKIKYGILDYKSSDIKIPVVYEPMKHRILQGIFQALIFEIDQRVIGYTTCTYRHVYVA